LEGLQGYFRLKSTNGASNILVILPIISILFRTFSKAEIATSFFEAF
jgi:hypothetical protein